VDFTPTKLGKVCRVIPGYAFKSSDWQTTGIRVAKIKNILDSQEVDVTSADCVPESLLTPKLRKYLLADGDILLAMTGATAGKIGKLRTSEPVLLNQRVAKIQPVEADPGYVWSVLRTREYEEKLYNLADGAAQPNMSGGQIEGLEIPLPPLDEQRRIAGILSAYDDLIENNRRRIKILEEVARALYREWFVNFRYPGHESIPLVPSPLGPIPQGWRVCNVGSLASYVSRGLSPAYSDDGPSIVLNQKCIRHQRLSLEPARRQRKPIPRSKLLAFGDVLINSTGVGTLGRVAQVYEPLADCTVDSHVSIVRARDEVDIDYFGYTLLAQEENFERQGVGATGQTELSRTAIADSELTLAPPDIQGAFGAKARATRSLAVLLQKEIENLRSTRDLLLTRLLGGA